MPIHELLLDLKDLRLRAGGFLGLVGLGGGGGGKAGGLGFSAAGGFGGEELRGPEGRVNKQLDHKISSLA